MEEAIYMVVIKYFTREGSKPLLPSKNEPCATKVVSKNGFYCTAKSSFLDIADILDPLLMAPLGKKQFPFDGSNHLS